MNGEAKEKDIWTQRAHALSQLSVAVVLAIALALSHYVDAQNRSATLRSLDGHLQRENDLQQERLEEMQRQNTLLQQIADDFRRGAGR